ncbi:MAG: DNA translocase FtsK 4TM domain-containing protein [Patescibacteria group bacterium]
MAKKKSKENEDKKSIIDEVPNYTKQAIMGICSFVVALIFLLAAFAKAGIIGDYAFTWLSKLFGVGYYLIPVVFIMLGISLFRGMEHKMGYSKTAGAILFFISGLGIIYLLPEHAGGIIGRWIATPLIKLFDVWATAAVLIAIFIISVLITFNIHITWEGLAFWKRFQKTPEEKEADLDDESALDKAVANAEANAMDSVSPVSAKALALAEAQKNMEKANEKKFKRGGLLDFSDAEEKAFASSVVMPYSKEFTPPPLNLLEKDKGKPETGDIKANANIIKRTLSNFNITVEMDEISIGPSVTRYALKPAEGVKLAKIVGLNNDLALALAAHPIRIEAPIPGKSLVGIEVPNTSKTTVGLATLLASSDYQESEKPLLVSLGKDITGRAHFGNLAKAPHMLIAGATGSGKSVTIHTVITSLLYRNSPENLKFIMIDPKRVELTLYNKIPHLLTPVITDPKKAILALKWAAKEMSRRYDILEQNTVRDIDSYHKTILAPAVAAHKKDDKSKEEEKAVLPETMPYIVVIIDELADIMQTYPRELESAIVRLAQMSRAVGIHLILSTQRPSVNVITGLIKANVPTRVALQVASQIDSRTILDQQGAEKLLGAGDMLYLGGEMSKPVRLQSAYISEGEVKKVVKYLADEYKDEIMNEINLMPTEAGSSAAFDSMSDALAGDSLEDQDDLYEAARDAVVSANKASTSYIQRKLGVGYSRAAKLMDLLEEHGVIGAANGSKAREVLGGTASIEAAADAMIDAAGGDGRVE